MEAEVASSESTMSNENDGHDATPFNPPPRTPLNTIPDPAQTTFHSRRSKRPDLPVAEFELQENPSFWADHNVQVMIRVRPPRIAQGHGRCLRQESGHSLVWLGHPETRFTFDHVACETVSQERVFQVAGVPMVENCLSGYNTCMFAYGQTGSGKTYTMMGEISENQGNRNQHCGLTPRIFEYLFKRIVAEEESRRDEQLMYSCKCSFLEIYNEQITDLLEPSSNNLQLREDVKKGVHVENLTEYVVTNVNDVVQLLLQGAANRKVAATHMNSESSRSHSVFTCTIESRWENDSMAHFRFARLNLVDLAGSERQKSSGAEGDRLKEAANINRSLSTLGLVIMSLVDLAHGKHRHVPYRDSRLTFLLQDSLGGNSKTTIIANISPSICSSSETLSTLKFAQRAKLIQNNAKVNADTSGDTNALQRQIQELKGQLSFLMKHAYLPRSLPSHVPSPSESRFVDLPGEYDNNTIQHFQNKLEHMEAILVGPLRREKVAERAVQNIEAELGHRLARETEEEAQHSKMILKFRKEEIKPLELLKDGYLSAENYLVQENDALLEESQLLQAGTDRMPVLNQYALENIRLKEQLQLYQNFYELGEREILVVELAELRNQLLDMLEDKANLSCHNDKIQELEDCKVMNSKLIREVEELRLELRNSQSQSDATHSFKDSQVFRLVDDYALLESRSMQSDAGDEIQKKDIDNVSRDEFMDAAGSLMEVEPQHCSGDTLHQHSVPKPENKFPKHGNLDRLNRMTKDLEELRLLNSQIQEEQELQVSCQHEAEIVREQVETETARTIFQLQEEVSTLEGNLDEKLVYMTRENTKLRNIVAAKDEEVNVLNAEWERAIAELTGFLVDGFRSLRSVSSQIQSITCAFPKSNVSISEHVERAARVFIEKEETISQLKRSLEDAQSMVIDMGQKLRSLKRVTMALTEVQNVDADDEISEEHISLMLNDKTDMVKMLKLKEARVIEAEKSANVAFIVINWLFDGKKISQNESESTIPIPFQYHLLHQIRDEVAETNLRLKVIEDFLRAEVNIFECFSSYGHASSPDSSSSSSERLKDLALPSLHRPLASLYAPSESCSDTTRNFLKMELEVLFDVFNTIHARLASVIDELNSRQSPEQENDLKHIEKIDHAESFWKKFEEVGLTVKEADLILNALVQANENSKQLSGMWKRTGEDLMIERANLIEEVESLKSSLCAKENENQLLHDQASWSLQELASSLSLLEESYQELESGREKLTTMYSDILSMGMEVGQFLNNTKSLPEDICLKIMERDFCSFVLYESYLGALQNNNSCQDAECGRCLFGDVDILQNGGKMIMITDGKSIDDYESLALKKELKRKEELLDGLLFDFSLLQESTSITKDNKDETEKLVCTLSRVRHELDEKTRHFDELLVQHKKLESHLANTEDALIISNSNFTHANETVETFLEQTAELKGLVNDLYLKSSEVEQQLEEQKEIVRSLEEEILQLGSSTEKKYILLVEDFEYKLEHVTGERDQIKKKVLELNDKLEMAYALNDEKEAIIVEARQDSKESKIYAEQKEEEVKILEHSIEELDSTVNVLENKVFEMDTEVERNRLIRDSLELELDILRQRMSAVENFTESVDSENKDENQISRPLQNKDIELHKARARIRFLEEERAEHDNEIKQYKEYVNELMVHAEAQASQYQQKYKTLEAMVREVKTDSVAAVEKSTARARGSSSPFRCIGSFVLERDQELSAAKLRIEELETLAIARHKEVCMLNTRLAGAESMTHDVIRDLLGVKLDMTNFANMIDQTQVHKFMEDARQQIEDILAKEHEIFSLRKQLDDANEERESCEVEISKRDKDLIAVRIAVEQLEERDRLLSAQNEMLQMDKRNLKRKIAELDEMVNALLGTREQGHRTSFHKKPLTIDNVHFSKRLEQSEKLLSRVNGELAYYYKSQHGDGSGTSYRKQKDQLR